MTASNVVMTLNTTTTTSGATKEAKKAAPVVKPAVKPVVTPAKKPAPALLEGQNLLAKQDCNACHRPDMKLVGPAYKSIAQKYKSSEANISTLAAKVIAGGSGNWGQVPMTPHAALSTTDAKKIVRYILSLSGK